MLLVVGDLFCVVLITLYSVLFYCYLFAMFLICGLGVCLCACCKVDLVIFIDNVGNIWVIVLDCVCFIYVCLVLSDVLLCLFCFVRVLCLCFTCLVGYYLYFVGYCCGVFACFGYILSCVLFLLFLRILFVGC